MSGAFPFHTLPYLAGFAHVGEPDIRDGAPSGVIRRPIAGTGLWDGLGPWPYLQARDDADLRSMADAYPDLVTLTLMTQPGFRPDPSAFDTILLKDHFLFDPSLPETPLSRRARQRLREAAREWRVEPAEDAGERMELARIYDEVSRRRGLAGTFFDYPMVHFDTLARLDESVFLRVGNASETVGMACGIRLGPALHLLHIAVTDAALPRHASYLLMHGVLEFCRETRLVLMMGGKPRNDGEGVERFKRRWSNRAEPVFLTRTVNRPDAYAALCGTAPDTSFFPAYRAPEALRCPRSS